MLDFSRLNRFKGKQFEIVSLVSEWAMAYGVEPEAIERQIAIAHAWCNANPKKAPKKDPVRFLYNFMRIAKKMGNLVSKELDRKFKETQPREEEVMTGEDFKRMREAI